MTPLMSLLVIAGAAAVLFALCQWWLSSPRRPGSKLYRSRLERNAAEARADKLLAEMLNTKEYEQLSKGGFLEVRSPSTPNRVYSISKDTGKIVVYDSGRRVMRLCVGPVDRLPDGDVVLIHKLMIEGNEAEYLRTANRF